MKVAKSTEDFKKIQNGIKQVKTQIKGQTISSKYLDLLEEIKGPINIRKLRKLGFHDWLRIEKDEIAGFREEDQKGYEAFVQGFLWYFEKHSSTNWNDNRTIYFDWSKLNSKLALTIYIKPLKYLIYNEGTGIGKQSGGGNDNAQKSPFPPPPSTVDPHQPPPPPPPTRDA